MILPIVAYGDNVLKKEADEIAKDYPNLKGLIENMFETMYNASGVGLAAPQIGSQYAFLLWMVVHLLKMKKRTVKKIRAQKEWRTLKSLH